MSLKLHIHIYNTANAIQHAELSSRGPNDQVLQAKDQLYGWRGFVISISFLLLFLAQHYDTYTYKTPREL